MCNASWEVLGHTKGRIWRTRGGSDVQRIVGSAWTYQDLEDGRGVNASWEVLGHAALK